MAGLFPTGSGLTADQLARAQDLARQAAENQEYLQSWLYDSAALASSAATTEITLFQTGQGQGGKTFADTNMQTNGQLPGDRQFLVKSVVITFRDTVNETITNADWGRLLGGYCALIVRDKPYPDYATIKQMVGGPGLVVGGHTTRGVVGSGTIGNALSFNEPFLILLGKGVPFRFYLNWPGGITIADSSTIRVFVHLYGRGTR